MRHGIESWNIMGISPGYVEGSAYSLVEILRGVFLTADISLSLVSLGDSA
jgi:hypothetical protein